MFNDFLDIEDDYDCCVEKFEVKSMQLEIEGIGQQKVTLSMWKKENNIFTHNSPHMPDKKTNWSCWDEYECPGDFISSYSDSAMGYGETEKEAILKFCYDNEINPPFWW